MTSPKNPTATKWTAASMFALVTLTSCATSSRDALPTAAPYFANRAAVQPIASTSAAALPNGSSSSPFLPGHFAPKSRLQEQVSDKQPRGMVYLRAAVGEEEIDVMSGTNFINETDATMIELGLEAGGRVMGGGFRFGGRVTDDDLLESSSVVDSSGQAGNFFAHLTIRPGGGKFRMPIRIGPEIRSNVLDVSSGAVGSLGEVDWLTIGGAVEIEPEFDIFRSDRSALSIYGRAHVGVGVAEASTNTTDYDTESTNIGAEVGVRFQAAKFLLTGGYMLHQTEYDESDPEGLTFVEETSWKFEGFFLSLGFRW